MINKSDFNFSALWTHTLHRDINARVNFDDQIYGLIPPPNVKLDILTLPCVVCTQLHHLNWSVCNFCWTMTFECVPSLIYVKKEPKLEPNASVLWNFLRVLWVLSCSQHHQHHFRYSLQDQIWVRKGYKLTRFHLRHERKQHWGAAKI